MNTVLDIAYYLMVAFGLCAFAYSIGTKSGRANLRRSFSTKFFRRGIVAVFIIEIPLAFVTVLLFKRYNVTDEDLHHFTAWFGLVGIVLIALLIALKLYRGNHE